MKYEDFQIVTRRCTLPQPVAARSMLEAVSWELLHPLTPPPKGVRLLGVSVSGFETAPQPSVTTQMRLAL